MSLTSIKAMLTRPRPYVLAAVVVLLVPTAAWGTHYRYGSNSWQPGAGTNDVDFQISEAWRRSFFVGSPMPGDVIRSSNIIEFGDGTSTGFDLLVTSIDVTNDWLFGVGLDPNRPAGDTTDTLIGHTYPSAGSFTMSTTGCCRVGQTSVNWHVNNPDIAQRVETLVDVGSGNRSPVSTLPPIVQCPISGMCSFPIPAADPDGDPLRYRLSTPAEAGDPSFNHPGPPEAPNAATVDPTTGVYRWDTTGATLGPAGANTLYSTQVTIEDLDGAGNVKSKIAVDFLIQLSTIDNPPVFDQPPTPTCGSTLNASAGSPLTFTVKAHDDPTDTVTLNVAGLPVGAVMTPGLPTSGNPVSSDFSWTPTAAQVGTHVVTFLATDAAGGQALCDLTLVVSPRVEADLSITKADSPDPVAVGSALTYTLTVLNGGPDPATGVKVIDTLPSGVTFQSATPSQGTCMQSGGTVTCDIGSLASGASATIDIVVVPNNQGSLSNTATVSGLEPDPNMGNNSATAETQVGPPPASCGGQPATIVGTVGDDFLVGTSGPDVIQALAGEDEVVGWGGDDVICGDSGDDDLSGGRGDDFLFGNGGVDELSGGRGVDQVVGGPGVDEISGDSGDDSVIGEAGFDELSGGSGDDLLNGWGGNDELSAGSGDDRLAGGRGEDELSAGSGDDRLAAGDGDDSLSGGSGSDNCDGGAGTDTEGNCEVIVNIP